MRFGYGWPPLWRWGFVNEWKVQISGERDARASLLQSRLDAGLPEWITKMSDEIRQSTQNTRQVQQEEPAEKSLCATKQALLRSSF
jgi:hypothetical protein